MTSKTKNTSKISLELEINKQLFSKYGLTEEEVTFIEKNDKTKVEERKITPLLPVYLKL